MDAKMEVAQTAITFIKDQFTVGLGAGSTIAYLVDLLAAEVKNGLEVQILTSSFSTYHLLLKKGLLVQRTADVAELDIYFDGCDQLDRDLNALKSGGGIHTREKLLASMATQFLLIGDDTKYAESFDNRFPLVIELLPEALSYVPARINTLFPGVKSVIRMSDKKDGAVITDNGNYLLDAWFSTWPELKQIDYQLNGITGVLDTSLFYNLAHKAIIAGKDGVRILEKTS